MCDAKAAAGRVLQMFSAAFHASGKGWGLIVQNFEASEEKKQAQEEVDVMSAVTVSRRSSSACLHPFPSRSWWMLGIKPCFDVFSWNSSLRGEVFFFVHAEGTISKEFIRCQNDIGVILQSEVELRVWLDLRPLVPGALPSGFPWVQGLQSI